MPNTILSISDYAFSYCNNLKELILPNNIEFIGCCFLNACSNVNSITIPKSLSPLNFTDTKYYPFVNSSVSKVIFEEGTKNIISHILINATKLTEVIIPNSVSSIGNYSFWFNCRYYVTHQTRYKRFYNDCNDGGIYYLNNAK